MAYKIGIITSSVREGAAGTDVAKWVLNTAKQRNDEGFEYELVQLKDYNLPVLGTEVSEEQGAAIGNWSAKLSEFDGYIFVVAEYNHALTGALKNALDYVKNEMRNKPAGFVGYGSLGGIRAIEGLRIVLAELGVATTHKTVNFLLGYDFENFSVFKPSNVHGNNTELLFTQLGSWTKAFKSIR